MSQQIIIAGLGGQGIMTLGQMLTYCGMKEGKNVTWLPSYGPEMRGGTANCNVIIADEPIGSPVVTEATAVIAFNQLSTDKFNSSVIPKGLMFVNSSIVKNKIEREDIQVFSVPVSEIAEELENSRVSNMVMLGAYVEATGAVKLESIMRALNKAFSGSKEHLLYINVKAFDAGVKYIQDNL